MSEKDKTISTIKSLREEEKLIPFVGAGFSANMGDFPLWAEFIDFLEKNLNADNPKDPISFAKMFGDNDPAESAQFFYWYKGYEDGLSITEILKQGKEQFRDLVFRKFISPIYNSDEYQQHELLIKKFKYIYTSNWDTLLEDTCCYIREKFGFATKYSPMRTNYSSGSDRYELKVYESKIGNSEKRQIIKFHGCQKDRSGTSIVAASADYYDRISESRNHPLDKKLQQDMEDNCFIFIGYSLRDVNVKYLLNQIYFKRWNDPYNKNTKLYFVSFDNPEEVSKHKADYLKYCNNLIPVYLCDESHPLHKIEKKDEMDLKQRKYIKKAEICDLLSKL